MQVAAREWRRSAQLLDIGCGAGRNAVPLAQTGWALVGTDLSRAMLTAAAMRVAADSMVDLVQLVLAPMDNLPFASSRFDFVVAHGIWNLARAGREFGRAVAEARGIRARLVGSVDGTQSSAARSADTQCAGHLRGRFSAGLSRLRLSGFRSD
jgi:SAM-dependent methyltransferase